MTLLFLRQPEAIEKKTTFFCFHCSHIFIFKIILCGWGRFWNLTLIGVAFFIIEFQGSTLLWRESYVYCIILFWREMAVTAPFLNTATLFIPMNLIIRNIETLLWRLLHQVQKTTVSAPSLIQSYWFLKSNVLLKLSCYVIKINFVNF